MKTPTRHVRHPKDTQTTVRFNHELRDRLLAAGMTIQELLDWAFQQAFDDADLKQLPKRAHGRVDRT